MFCNYYDHPSVKWHLISGRHAFTRRRTRLARALCIRWMSSSETCPCLEVTANQLLMIEDERPSTRLIPSDDEILIGLSAVK